MPEAKAGFDELLSQLRATNVLLVEITQKQLDIKQADLIARLAKAGTPNVEIAAIIGTSLNTVQVTVSRVKKAPKKAKKAKN